MELTILNDAYSLLNDFMPLFMILAAVCIADYLLTLLFNLLRQAKKDYVS